MSSAPNRVLSVDVLRGLTIAFMILVNDPGDWGHVYPQLDHAPWNGFTCTDLVFPTFLFLVGISLVFSLQSRIRRGDSGTKIALHILSRAAILFGIKLLLSAYPHFHVGHLRLYGVLTRIALCYAAAGLICLFTMRARTLMGVIAILLVVYYILMRFVPVPGLGTPTIDFPVLDPVNNLAAWLDRAVNAFTQHYLHTGSLYDGTHDPEGLLSTIPAIATTLIGSVTALWIRPETRVPRYWRGIHIERAGLITSNRPGRCLMGLILTGLTSLTAGLVWDIWFPINKNLWTSSYVLFAAGWSLLLLAVCYYLTDARHIENTRAGKILLWPWLVFGSNAITAFILSNFIVETMIWIKVPAPAPAKSVTAWFWSYKHLFAFHGSTEITSLAFALAFTALCLLPNWLLYRKRIFLKI